MATRVWILIPTYLCLTTGTSDFAWAFGVDTSTGNLARWFDSRALFDLDPAGAPGIDDGSDLRAVRNAAQSWTDVSCADLRLIEVEQGLGYEIPSSTVLLDQELDGRNFITWVGDERWTFGQFVLGVTSPVTDTRNGEIFEADIVLNSRFVSWSTADDPRLLGNRIDVESVVVHELGHFIGLMHVLDGEFLDDPPTMSPSIDSSLRSRDLSDDDRSGACFVYPAASFRCADHCDCPTIVAVDEVSKLEFNEGQVECLNSVCSLSRVLPIGGKALGVRCVTPTECDSGLFCQPTNAGGFCSQSCTPANPNCPLGFECLPLNGASNGACILRELGGVSEGICLSQGNILIGDGGAGSCPCDLTSACDRDCDLCDPDCRSDSGCRAVPVSFWAFVSLGLVAGRRRRW